MKILVGYNGGESGKMALAMARDMAGYHSAYVYVITSMEGGRSDTPQAIREAEENLAYAREVMEYAGIPCDCSQSVRGLSPGEDLVLFARGNHVDHIFLGIKKISKVQKAILGSTARHVILNAPCPVTTTRFDPTRATTEDILRDKRILVVDDEADILETIEELMDMCSLETVKTYEEARKRIRETHYDLAVLDIMGVQGYKILERARERKIPALMLTAHALTPEHLKTSIEKEADAYVPKDMLADIPVFVADLLTARQQGKKTGFKWFSLLKPLFDRLFGDGWRKADEDFWDEFDARQLSGRDDIQKME